MHTSATTVEAKIGALVHWHGAGRAWRILLAHAHRKRCAAGLWRRHALRRLCRAAAASHARAVESFAAALAETRADSIAAASRLGRAWHSLSLASQRHAQQLTPASGEVLSWLGLRVGWGALRRSVHQALHQAARQVLARQHCRARSLALAVLRWSLGCTPVATVPISVPISGLQRRVRALWCCWREVHTYRRLVQAALARAAAPLRHSVLFATQQRRQLAVGWRELRHNRLRLRLQRGDARAALFTLASTARVAVGVASGAQRAATRRVQHLLRRWASSGRCRALIAGTAVVRAVLSRWALMAAVWKEQRRGKTFAVAHHLRCFPMRRWRRQTASSASLWRLLQSGLELHRTRALSRLLCRGLGHAIRAQWCATARMVASVAAEGGRLQRGWRAMAQFAEWSKRLARLRWRCGALPRLAASLDAWWRRTRDVNAGRLVIQAAWWACARIVLSTWRASSYRHQRLARAASALHTSRRQLGLAGLRRAARRSAASWDALEGSIVTRLVDTNRPQAPTRLSVPKLPLLPRLLLPPLLPPLLPRLPLLPTCAMPNLLVAGAHACSDPMPGHGAVASSARIRAAM